MALATVVGVEGSAPRSAGARMVVRADGSFVGTIGGGNLEWQVIRQAREALADGRPRRFSVHLVKDLGMCCGGAVDVYIEPVQGQERMVIYGAGHIAKPTAAIARDLGFAVTVVDARDDWATTERFPGCAVIADDPRAHARALATDGRTWILLTTHEHALDQDLLELLVRREYAWLGLVGSRAKVAKFFLRLRAGGVDEAHFRRVSAPVGLDLGAETPAEIAVAVAAEIVRARRGGSGRSMSEEPLPARGGDGVGRPPRASAPATRASRSRR